MQVSLMVLSVNMCCSYVQEQQQLWVHTLLKTESG